MWEGCLKINFKKNTRKSVSISTMFFLLCKLQHRYNVPVTVLYCVTRRLYFCLLHPLFVNPPFSKFVRFESPFYTTEGGIFPAYVAMLLLQCISPNSLSFPLSFSLLAFSLSSSSFSLIGFPSGSIFQIKIRRREERRNSCRKKPESRERGNTRVQNRIVFSKWQDQQW